MVHRRDATLDEIPAKTEAGTAIPTSIRQGRQNSAQADAPTARRPLKAGQATLPGRPGAGRAGYTSSGYTTNSQEIAMANTLDRERSPIAGEPNSGDAVLELFQTAALLLGDQQEAITTVEKAVASAQLDPCAEPDQALVESREIAVKLALARAVELNPAAFDPANVSSGPNVCFDTDDLESTGVSADQLAQLVSGPARNQLRDWLEHLQPEARVIFVLRAMLGKDSEEVAQSLQRSGAGPGWAAAQVGQVFRGALCSLAGSLAHAPTHS